MAVHGVAAGETRSAEEAETQCQGGGDEVCFIAGSVLSEAGVDAVMSGRSPGMDIGRGHDRGVWRYLADDHAGLASLQLPAPLVRDGRYQVHAQQHWAVLEIVTEDTSKNLRYLT
jgi:hypothetical protein